MADPNPSSESKYTDPRDIIKALELRPFDEIVAESKQRGMYPRASGRTTRKMVAALYDLARGYNIVYWCKGGASTHVHGHQLKSYAHRLGLDLNKIEVINRDSTPERYRDNPWLLFKGEHRNGMVLEYFDHYWIDPDDAVYKTRQSQFINPQHRADQ